MTGNDKIIKGRISAVQRDNYKVLSDMGECLAKVKGSFYKTQDQFPVIGDYVILRFNPLGISIIEEICERKSIFTRPNQLGHAAGYVKTIKDQALAANFDYVFITASLNQNYNLNRIIRYITVTLQSGAKPVVILTKADLCEHPEDYIREVQGVSDQADVFAISAVQKTGLEQLKPYLKPDTTIVLLGSSGVGKSTLVNTIAGKEIMKVNEIRQSDGRGHHTTTHRQLMVLPSGVTIIDTPGIRELGLMNVDEGIEDTFSDVIQLIHQCKFSNCRHQTEPGCAIKEAIEAGTLTEDRWNLYHNLNSENTWAKSKMIIRRENKIVSKR